MDREFVKEKHRQDLPRQREEVWGVTGSQLFVNRNIGRQTQVKMQEDVGTDIGRQVGTKREKMQV